MVDYETLDLSKLCNAGPELLADDAQAEAGYQDMRGLPFLVGSPDGKPGGDRFIAVGPDEGGVTIPVNARARRVILAHCLLESNVAQDGRWGVPVADYIFHLAGGVQERVPVRERFEIGTTPGVGTIPGGHQTFRAVTDGHASMMSRYEGPWGMAGWRQLEARGNELRNYWLWPWVNPHPERTIESLEIVPVGARFIIAGITLSHVDEHPFAREGMRPARIILTSPEDADKPFDLEVEVDRGEASYVYALPGQSAEEFLNDRYKGWGEEQNTISSPSYVEINAIPSATVTVKQGGNVIGEVNWGEVEEKGSVEAPRMRIDLLDRGKNWVQVEVVDEDTGTPVPCRIHFRSPEGVPYQPYGHHNHVNSNLDTFNFDLGGDIRLGQITYAYIDGTCQGWLPRGEVIVDIAHGFEYEPLRTTVKIEPGQQQLTLRLKRWTDMNAQRWYSGDPHMHFISAMGALTDARSEDVNVAHVEQTQLGGLFAGVDEFVGYPIATRDGKHIVSVSQENRQNMMSHILLWGLKRPVMPFCTDGQGEGGIGGTMETTLSYWADECHAQGGTVISAHFWGFNREAVVLVATGRVDALEFKGHQRQYTHEEYYRLLNCGYQVPLVGGTDKMTNETAVGFYRTYVKLQDDEEFNFDTWCKNVRKGRTFMTAGPIMHLTVNGQDIGDTVEISGPGTVEVEAWAESVVPIHRLDILQEGRVVATAESAEPARRLEIKKSIRVDGHTWLAARAGSATYYGDPDYDALDRGIYAHTGPTYVACGGEWWMFDKDVTRHMLDVIEGDLAYIREVSGQAPPDLITHPHGDDDHIEYLSRPFIEAREAIHERMRKLGVTL